MSDWWFEALSMLGIHASIAVAITMLATRWAGADYRKVLAFMGGHADASAIGGEVPLGWTRNPAIAVFAYLYSFESGGFAWLYVSIVCITLGRFSEKVVVDAVVRPALVLIACIMLTKLDAFAETINYALE